MRRQKPQLLAELEAANRVSAGLLMPQAVDDHREREAGAGLRAVEPRDVGADRPGPARVASDEFRAEFAERDTFRVMLECLDVERQVAGGTR